LNPLRPTAIVPVRSLRHGKSRLAGSLRPAQRERLVATMLDAVLGALEAALGRTQVLLLTADASLERRGVVTLSDPGVGLNAALRAGLDAAAARGGGALVVAADLPLIVAADIMTLIAAGEDTDVVVARDDERCGTNALWVRDPAAFAPRFGPQSAAAHAAEARARGMSCRTLDRAGLGFDVDTERDVLRLRRLRDARFSFLENGAPERTPTRAAAS
jgi:2-phospho-L-lactate guanylyltransferase